MVRLGMNTKGPNENERHFTQLPVKRSSLREAARRRGLYEPPPKPQPKGGGKMIFHVGRGEWVEVLLPLGSTHWMVV